MARPIIKGGYGYPSQSIGSTDPNSKLGDGPVNSLIAITPSDTIDMTQQCRGIWVGGAGNISVVCPDGTSQVLQGAGAGQEVDVRAKRINATGTTASNLIGLV